jgi:hypothetical protein
MVFLLRAISVCLTYLVHYLTLPIQIGTMASRRCVMRGMDWSEGELRGVGGVSVPSTRMTTRNRSMLAAD